MGPRGRNLHTVYRTLAWCHTERRVSYSQDGTYHRYHGYFCRYHRSRIPVILQRQPCSAHGGNKPAARIRGKTNNMRRPRILADQSPAGKGGQAGPMEISERQPRRPLGALRHRQRPYRDERSYPSKSGKSNGTLRFV